MKCEHALQLQQGQVQIIYLQQPKLDFCCLRKSIIQTNRQLGVLSSETASGQFQLPENLNLARQCQMTMYRDCHNVSDGESDSGLQLSSDSHGIGGLASLPVGMEKSPNHCPAPESAVPKNSSQQGGHSLQDPHTSKIPLSAEKLQEEFRVAEEKRREQAFLASFKFDTQRCTPTAPCRSCLDFCKTPLPLGNVDQVLALDGDDDEEDGPPFLKLTVAQQAAPKRRVRHGPKSRSSEYRGVTLHNRTGRWEAHIWYANTQVYLGASETKEEAARAHDKAAILLSGPDVYLNFNSESYQQEMEYLYKLSKEQLVIYLRRDSRGYGAQAMYPGVKHVRNRYHAMRGGIFMKSYYTEDEAARAVYNEALRSSNGALASWILNTHHIRNMPSYAAQRLAALYPDVVKAMHPRNEHTASESKRKSNSTSSPPLKEPCSGATTLPISVPASTSTAAIATAPSSDPEEEQLPGTQINECAEVRSATRIPNSIRPSLSVVHQRYRPLAACLELQAQAPTAPMLCPHRHIDVNSIPAQQHSSTKPSTELNPETHEPPATILSSCQAASVLSSFKQTGPQVTSSAPHQNLLSTPDSAVESPRVEAGADVVKFKLFNTEICVPASLGHDSFKIDTPGESSVGVHGESSVGTPGESSVGVCNRMILPPRKRCKFMGEARHSASAFKLFNVEICVPAAALGPGHDTFKIDSPGETTVGVCNNHMILPPRKRCKFMGEVEAGPSASAFKLFNVEICVPAAAPTPGHDAFKIDTWPGDSTVGVCNNHMILPPRKRCKFMGEAGLSASAPYGGLGTQNQPE